MNRVAAVLFLMAAAALYAVESHEPIRTIGVGNRTAAPCNVKCPSPRRYRKQQHALLYLGSAHLRVSESAFSHLLWKMLCESVFLSPRVHDVDVLPQPSDVR